MLSETEKDDAIELLLEADMTRTPCMQISKRWPQITLNDGYAISNAIVQRRVAAGASIIGHKIGLTSKAMQQSSQVDEPVYGILLDDMVVPDGAKVLHENYCAPRVEPELTFILKESLKGRNIGLADVLRATEYVVPSLEVIDARVQNPRTVFDTVSDNGSAARIVLGGRPVRPDEIDMRWVGAIVYRNSEIEETGVAASVLNHPAMAVAWLVKKLSFIDSMLQPGHLVLSGSFTRPVVVRQGDTVRADFGPLGNVSMQFV